MTELWLCRVSDDDQFRLQQDRPAGAYQDEERKRLAFLLGLLITILALSLLLELAEDFAEVCCRALQARRR